MTCVGSQGHKIKGVYKPASALLAPLNLYVELWILVAQRCQSPTKLQQTPIPHPWPIFTTHIHWHISVRKCHQRKISAYPLATCFGLTAIHQRINCKKIRPQDHLNDIALTTDIPNVLFDDQRRKLISRGFGDMNDWEAMEECYWEGGSEVLGEKPVPARICPPQIPHGLTRVSEVNGRRLTSWINWFNQIFTIIWPRCIVTNFFVTKPTRCTNFTNLFCHETLHVSDSSSVHHQQFIHCTLSNGICHTAL